MDGLESTRHAKGVAQLRQRQARMVADQPPQALLMRRRNFGLRPGKAMPRAEVACSSSLLQQFLDHALGYFVARRDLRPRGIPAVIRSNNPLPQIYRKCLHAPLIAQTPHCWL